MLPAVPLSRSTPRAEPKLSCKHALCIFCYENLSEITKNAKQNSQICKNAVLVVRGAGSLAGWLAGWQKLVLATLEAENSCCLCSLLSADDADAALLQLQLLLLLLQSYEKLLSVYKMVAGCEPLRILQVHHVHQIFKQATDARKLRRAG